MVIILMTAKPFLEAIDLIEKLKQLGLKNDLILFDGGYSSKGFIFNM